MSSSEHRTQQCRILELLREDGGWVPLPRILALGVAQYSARIYELRRQGHEIQNRVEWVGGKRHSWFRLLANSQQSLFGTPHGKDHA